MNRYMNRYVLALVALVSWNTAAMSQVKLTGPSEVKVGKLNKIAVAVDKGADLKVLVLKSGLPNTDEYLMVKEFDGTPVILIMPPDEEGAWNYTIVASVNDAGKTYQTSFTTKVNPAEDDKRPKPGPKPEPEKLTPFQQDVETSYKASPDSVSRDKLIQAFTEVKAKIPALKSYGDLETEIVNSVSKQLPDRAKLRPVRNRVSAYLIEKTGEDPRAWDAKVAADTCDDVIAALRRLS